MYFKGIVTELIWFLQGRTDLRYLLENDCHIWTGDAYKVYDKDFDREHPPFSAPYPKRLTQKEFEEKIMTDDEFNGMYGNLGSIYGKQWRSWDIKPDIETKSYIHKGETHFTFDINEINKNAEHTPALKIALEKLINLHNLTKDHGNS
jgi:thymidylate synthase